MAMMEQGDAESLIDRFQLQALSATPGILEATEFEGTTTEAQSIVFDFAGFEE